MKRFAIFMLAALPMAAADDVSGKWTIEGDIANNPINMSCDVKQDADAKVTGKCALAGQSMVEIAGNVKDGKIKFAFTTDSGYTLTFSGMLEKDTMEGNIEVSGTTGTFSGKMDPK